MTAINSLKSGFEMRRVKHDGVLSSKIRERKFEGLRGKMNKKLERGVGQPEE